MNGTTTLTLNLHQTLSSLPPSPPSNLRAQTRQLLKEPNIPLLVALDDDPTGTQTCHDVSVLTVWDIPTLTQEFHSTPPGSGFFILTNSRALHPPDAHALIVEICRNLQAAAQQTGVTFEVVLRGDSTLRGHFPTECEAVEEVLGKADAWILAPFFLQGGRYTIGDVHYVAEGERLVPVGETPFARDATFGYRSSDLREWVVEKSKGAIGRGSVKSLSLDVIRGKGREEVSRGLMAFEKGSVVNVNAAAEEDVDVVVLGILEGLYSFRFDSDFESIWLTRASSCQTWEALSLPNRCCLRLSTSGNIAYSSYFCSNAISTERSRRTDSGWLIRSQDYRATGISCLWSRLETHHNRPGCRETPGISFKRRRNAEPISGPSCARDYARTGCPAHDKPQTHYRS